MNKIELTERIMDAIIDPWTMDVSDMYESDLLTIEQATGYLAELRRDEESAELEEDERLPKEVTPELYMEVYNCMVRSARHEQTIRLMADYLTDNECVCEYDCYYTAAVPDAVRVLPCDFIEERFPFNTEHGNEPDAYELIMIGKNSAATFDPEDEYCWFDTENGQLFSTDTPFKDGVIDAYEVARYMLEDNPEFLEYMKDSIMDDDDLNRVFKYERGM